MIKKFKIDFPAFTGTEKRKVYVYLPESYDKNKRKKYPVLYMFDGHNVFYDKDASYGRAWRLGKYLDSHKTQLIVVAVECHRGGHGQRELEYSPYRIGFRRDKKYDGCGDETIKWFINVLKNRIDSEYRTLSNRENTFIMGSSMGGIMTTYAILKYNSIFSRGCSLSPAYFIYPEEILQTIKECKIKKDTTLYTDYGTKDLKGKNGIKAFNDINNALLEKKINITSRIVYEGIHRESTWEKQLDFAINTLLYE